MSGELSVNRHLKVAAWAVIGGTVLTAYSLYRGHQYAKENPDKRFISYALPIFCSPYTFFVGALLGGALKGYPIMDAFQFFVKAHWTILKNSPSLIIAIARFPFNIAKWLLT